MYVYVCVCYSTEVMMMDEANGQLLQLLLYSTEFASSLDCIQSANSSSTLCCWLNSSWLCGIV